MYCARVLGFAKEFPLWGFDRLFGLAWFGFAINAVSGVLLFIGEPRGLAVTPAFWIKMVLIVFAGLSLWALEKALHGEPDHTAPYGAGALGAGGGIFTGATGDIVVTRAAKVAAIASIVFWLAAITAGRIDELHAHRRRHRCDGGDAGCTNREPRAAPELRTRKS